MMAGPADLLLTGGDVYTVDASRSWARSIAIKNKKIAAVGTDAQVRALAGPRTEVVELGGRMVLPGFQDAHVHASGGGLERITCDLSQAHDLPGYLAAVRESADRRPDATWITGGGWSLDVFPGGVPSKEDLDRVVADRPVFLANRDHHGVWVNSRALALAGIDARTPDPPDGRIERDAAGVPSGTLHEGAMDLVRRVVPPPTVAEQVAGIVDAQRYLHSLGITGWQEAIVGDYAVTPDCFAAYLDADRRGLLTARVTGALWWRRGTGTGQLAELVARRERAASTEGAEQAASTGGAEQAGQRRFRATSVKIMQDGICENFTAAMLDPYLAAGGGPQGARGTSYFDPAELAEAVTAIDAAGFDVHVHAIGDRAVREALDAVAVARAASGPGLQVSEARSRPQAPEARSEPGRHHIAHLQVVHPDDLPRFRALGVAANCQPLWACNEPQMTELTLPFLGPERAGWQYPFGSLARSGALLCFGSDWPVSSPNPLWLIHTAVNRTPPPGYPYAGPEAAEPFLPAQRLDLPTAIAAATIGSAYINHDEQAAGSIEPGKRADLVVLDRNLFAHPEAEVALARADLTLVDGAVVHARPGADL